MITSTIQYYQKQISYEMKSQKIRDADTRSNKGMLQAHFSIALDKRFVIRGIR